LQKLRLVGGTGLALQYGHRKSIDIDLFGELKFDENELYTVLSNIGNLQKLNITESIKVYRLDKIKLDIVDYPYKWLKEPIKENGFIIASDTDIAAMKLSAITNRGTKKDFIDLYYILQKFSLNEILGFYSKKFQDGNIFLLLKSLAYFEDADPEPMPYMFEKLDWLQVKNKIKQAVSEY
jgi:hypothetical protein